MLTDVEFYRRLADKLEESRSCKLEPLTPEQKWALLKRWYEARNGSTQKKLGTVGSYF